MAVLLLAYPAVRLLSGYRDAVLPASPAAEAGLLQASFELYQAGRFQESIAAERGWEITRFSVRRA